MQLRKYRWSRDYEAAEEDLVQLLATKRITANRWTASEHQDFAAQRHANDKQLWCVEGSFRLETTGGHTYNLQAGDALDVPAGTEYHATAGFSGCTLYEAPTSDL